MFCAQRNLLKSIGGKWEFPGGKIESGETRERALIRERKEELDWAEADMPVVRRILE